MSTKAPITEVKTYEEFCGIPYKTSAKLLSELKDEMKLSNDDFIESTMNFIDENEVYC